MADDNNKSDIARRQNEEWERAQKKLQLTDLQNQPVAKEIRQPVHTKQKTRKLSRNLEVAMRFWADGILRIIVLATIAGGVYATVQTDFWEYSPVTNVKASHAVICWPKHYYGENITFAEGEGVSYVNPEALPPDIRAYYEGKNAEIMAMLDDPRSELMRKAKWGGYPVITVWNEAQKKPGEPLLEVKAVESEAAQTCRRYSQEAQRVALNSHQ